MLKDFADDNNASSFMGQGSPNDEKGTHSIVIASCTSDLSESKARE